MEKFESTTEGYLLAKQWLIDIGKWDEISTTGFSVDGFSIVHAANIIWEKKLPECPSHEYVMGYDSYDDKEGKGSLGVDGESFTLILKEKPVIKK